MTTTYDVNHYIEKFKAIPDDKWYDGGDYFNPKNNDCRCALGWLLERDEKTGGWTDGGYLSEFHQLNVIFANNGMNVHFINDGKNKRYNQDHPKRRILAALNDIKKVQNA